MADYWGSSAFDPSTLNIGSFDPSTYFDPSAAFYPTSSGAFGGGATAWDPTQNPWATALGPPAPAMPATLPAPATNPWSAGAPAPVPPSSLNQPVYAPPGPPPGVQTVPLGPQPYQALQSATPQADVLAMLLGQTGGDVGAANALAMQYRTGPAASAPALRDVQHYLTTQEFIDQYGLLGALAAPPIAAGYSGAKAAAQQLPETYGLRLDQVLRSLGLDPLYTASAPSLDEVYWGSLPAWQYLKGLWPTVPFGAPIAPPSSAVIPK